MFYKLTVLIGIVGILVVGIVGIALLYSEIKITVQINKKFFLKLKINFLFIGWMPKKKLDQKVILKNEQKNHC